MEQDWSPITLRKKEVQKPKIVNPSTPKYKEDEDGMPIKKTLPKDFGQRMQAARLQKGWSQKELAQKLNVKISDIQEYEKKTTVNVNRALARRIEKVLETTLF